MDSIGCCEPSTFRKAIESKTDPQLLKASSSQDSSIAENGSETTSGPTVLELLDQVITLTGEVFFQVLKTFSPYAARSIPGQSVAAAREVRRVLESRSSRTTEKVRRRTEVFGFIKVRWNEVDPFRWTAARVN